MTHKLFKEAMDHAVWMLCMSFTVATIVDYLYSKQFHFGYILGLAGVVAAVRFFVVVFKAAEPVNEEQIKNG